MNGDVRIMKYLSTCLKIGITYQLMWRSGMIQNIIFIVLIM